MSIELTPSEPLRGNHKRRQCEQCSGWFRVWDYHPRQRFCSLRCFGLFNNPRVLADRRCAACGTVFRPRKAVRVLCSMQCAAGWKHNPKRLERAA